MDDDTLLFAGITAKNIDNSAAIAGGITEAGNSSVAGSNNDTNDAKSKRRHLESGRVITDEPVCIAAGCSPGKISYQVNWLILMSLKLLSKRMLASLSIIYSENKLNLRYEDPKPKWVNTKKKTPIREYERKTE